MHNIKLIVILFFFIHCGIGHAQVATTSELYKTFKSKDSLLFEAGFNNCKLSVLSTQLTEDLEFYHDKGGIQDKVEFLKAIKENICSSPERKPIRKLTPNTMKVYPLFEQETLYGAIVEGKHEFYIKEPNKELVKTGSALFSGLWILENEQWKVKRIYSYHHQPK